MTGPDHAGSLSPARAGPGSTRRKSSRPAGRQGHAALDDVLELAHVARSPCHLGKSKGSWPWCGAESSSWVWPFPSWWVAVASRARRCIRRKNSGPPVSDKGGGGARTYSTDTASTSLPGGCSACESGTKPLLACALGGRWRVAAERPGFDLILRGLGTPTHPALLGFHRGRDCQESGAVRRPPAKAPPVQRDRAPHLLVGLEAPGTRQKGSNSRDAA
jgi:hypothetical protein